MASPSTAGQDPMSSMSVPPPLGQPAPSGIQQLGSGLEMQGPDPAKQAAQIQNEIAAIQQLVDRVAVQYPSATGPAKTVMSGLESMLQSIVATMAPSPGSIPEPPPMP